MRSAADLILIVEDDPNIASLVAKYLRDAGFDTQVVHDGREALAFVQRQAPDFVVLDLMLPGMDGREVCREIRRSSDVPVLMLTAREEETDRIAGFALGADDYVVKPFSPRELVERVKAIKRRMRPQEGAPSVLRQGGLLLDPEKHKVQLDGEMVILTPSEFKLLQRLMASPGRVFSRDELIGSLYSQGETVIDRVIDVHIGKLRQKIESDPSAPVYILTVHGIGYQFAETNSN